MRKATWQFAEQLCDKCMSRPSYAHYQVHLFRLYPPKWRRRSAKSSELRYSPGRQCTISFASEPADLPKAWTKREYLGTLERKGAANLHRKGISVLKYTIFSSTKTPKSHHMGLDKARNEAFEVLNCLQFANYTPPADRDSTPRCSQPSCPPPYSLVQIISSTIFDSIYYKEAPR